MADAESEVKKGRIRHCYPRQEVYHRWIHSPEYVYASDGCLVSGKFNYLRCRNIGKFVKDEDIKKMWGCHKQSIIAVIDRENNKICISTNYTKWYTELVNALPDNYEIFWCGGEIPTPNILSFTPEDKEVLCKEHLKYSVEQYVEYTFRPFYNSLKGRLTLNSDIDNLYNYPTYKGYKYPCYNSIKEFVKKYKIRKYSWFKESLNPKFKLNTYWPSSWDITTIELPSIKKVLNNTVFTNKQKEYFRKRYFYSKHCYGRGIPFKDVELYWNKEVSSKEMCDYFNKHNIYWLDDYRTESCITWNDYVIRSHEIEEKHRSKYIEENIAKSNQNRKEAIEQANAITSQEDVILAWRNGSRIRDYKIDYREFVIPRRRGQCGTWRTSYIYAGNISFKNTQLKLVGENVVTSRHASVPLSSAIATFHLFDSCRRTYDATGKDRFTFPDRFKVGIYNLRDIQYVEKFTDNREKLGYKSWLIRIGCHNLWLDDIMNFIRYYHLEDQFLNRPEDNNKKDNSKLK